MKKDYNELFAEFLTLIEFSLSKQEEGDFSLIDLQHANLGDIESDRFDNAEAMTERLQIYINDYLLDDEVWGSYLTCEEALKENPHHPCKSILDMLAYHTKEVDLNKVNEML